MSRAQYRVVDDQVLRFLRHSQLYLAVSINDLGKHTCTLSRRQIFRQPARPPFYASSVHHRRHSWLSTFGTMCHMWTYFYFACSHFHRISHLLLKRTHLSQFSSRMHAHIPSPFLPPGAARRPVATTHSPYAVLARRQDSHP